MNKQRNNNEFSNNLEQEFYDNDLLNLKNKHQDEDNFVKYRIFDISSNSIDYYNNLLKEITEYLLVNYIKDYIWQKEPFSLKIYNKQHTELSKLPIHLYGNTKFEESIDDEWFIVYILLELTNKFKNIVISIQDNDGEFLLIESAKVLPKWIKPTNSKNRVFLKNGEIHIIPLPTDPSQIDIIPYKMDINSALSIFSNNNNYNINTSSSSSNINEILKKRLSKFYNLQYFKEDQNQIKLAYLPIEIGYLLNQYPQLISDITRCFYNRDLEDMKSITTMNRFPMTTESSDKLITTNIRFTRCLYAMLKLQQFKPPSRNWYPQLPKPSHPTFDSCSLGVKIICGLEMLYNKSKTNNSNNNNTSYKFNDDSNWLSYLKELKLNNYFENEKEGSKLYKEKLITAKNSYLDINKQQVQQEPLYILIDQVLKSKSTDEMFKIVQDSDMDKIESEDNWLNEETPDKFEDLIKEFEKEQKSSINKKSNSNRKKQQSKDDDYENPNMVNDFSNQFKSMLSKLSSIEGIDFNEGGKRNNNNNNDGISFDSNKFMNLLKSFTGDEDDNDSYSDESDDMYQDIGDYDSDSEENDKENEEDESEEDEEDNEDDDGDDEDEKEFKYVEFLKKSTIKQYMKRMDQELNSKTIGGSSFELEATSIPKEYQDQDIDNNNFNNEQKKEEQEKEQVENTAPQKVDLNLNLVKNLLESLTEQQGLAGPASNLLREMKDKKKKEKKPKKKNN